MQFMMLLAPITFPIAMLAGLGWCIGIALLEQPHGLGYALTWYCLTILVILMPWLTLKLAFCVIVGISRKLGLIPPARPTYSLGYEESLYWFRVLAFFDGKRSRIPKKPVRRNSNPPRIGATGAVSSMLPNTHIISLQRSINHINVIYLLMALLYFKFILQSVALIVICFLWPLLMVNLVCGHM